MKSIEKAYYFLFGVLFSSAVSGLGGLSGAAAQYAAMAALHSLTAVIVVDIAVRTLLLLGMFIPAFIVLGKIGNGAGEASGPRPRRALFIALLAVSPVIVVLTVLNNMFFTYAFGTIFGGPPLAEYYTIAGPVSFAFTVLYALGVSALAIFTLVKVSRRT